METKILDICNIDNWKELILNSQCSNLFHYKWYLIQKNVTEALGVYQGNALVAVMPLFESKDKNKIQQSTIYVPYGGPVFIFKNENYRKDLEMKRKISNMIATYLVAHYKQVDFSTDTDLVDIIPYIRCGFIPEYRLTYIINVERDVNEWIKEWSYSKRYDFNKALKQNPKVIKDPDFQYFNIERAVFWDTDYDLEHDPVERAGCFMKEAVKHNNALPVVALKDDRSVAGVFMAWDHRKAYILYSYYIDRESLGFVPYLFTQLYDYVRDALHLKEIDLEGSVLEGIENFNISLAARQRTFYNLHWCEDITKLQIDFYKYE